MCLIWSVIRPQSRKIVVCLCLSNVHISAHDYYRCDTERNVIFDVSCLLFELCFWKCFSSEKKVTSLWLFTSLVLMVRTHYRLCLLPGANAQYCQNDLLFRKTAITSTNVQTLNKPGGTRSHGHSFMINMSDRELRWFSVNNTHLTTRETVMFNID